MVKKRDETGLIISYTPADVSHIADKIAGDNALPEYRLRKSVQTLRAQDADLRLFQHYLATIHVGILGDLRTDAYAWQGITAGFIDGFLKWQMAEGYTLSSVNRRLATIKRYLGLVKLAKIITADQFTDIQLIHGYRRKDAYNVDKRRSQTSLDRKKPTATFLTTEQCSLICRHPPTMRGLRDEVMVRLFLDLGLRCGELAALRVEHFDLMNHTVTFYRSKVYRTQTHAITEPVTQSVVYRYLQTRPAKGDLWYHIREDGTEIEHNLNQREIYRIINRLGKSIGVPDLGPHDLRHTWCENVARNETGLKQMQEAGGWMSLEMPMRYQKTAEIANDGVKMHKG